MKTCIITIIKNETSYLEQWIVYHINLGIDTLFIFEDVGSESHANITCKYKQVQLMSVLDIYYTYNDRQFAIDRRVRNKPMQYIFQQLAYRKFTNGYDWCFFIDVDEYITCEDKIHNVLNLYKEYDAVVMQWQNYNANGYFKKPKEPYSLIDTYTQKCGNSIEDENRHITTKIILNCHKYKSQPFTQHHPHIESNWCYTDLSQNMTRKIYDNIYVRHYITKSYEEYVHKIKVRGMSYIGHRDIDEFFVYNPDMIEYKDQLLSDICK